MSKIMTLASCTHTPSIIPVLYSLGPSIHIECMGREQSCSGIIIRVIQWSCILLVFISPTWLLGTVTRI